MDDAVLKKRVKSTETLISISSEHEMQTVQPLRVDGEVVAMTGGVNHHMEKAQLGERSADLEELIATATKVQGEAKSEKQITNSRIDRSEFANSDELHFRQLGSHYHGSQSYSRTGSSPSEQRSDSRRIADNCPGG